MNYLMISVKLALLLTAVSARAQQAPTAPDLDCRVLTGRVTDPFAYPLTGATIMLRSPGQGFSPEAFSTNAEGHYIITTKQSIPRNTIMEVSAVGYATLEALLLDCKPLDLTMTPLNDAPYKVKFKSKRAPGSGKVR